MEFQLLDGRPVIFVANRDGVPEPVYIFGRPDLFDVVTEGRW